MDEETMRGLAPGDRVRMGPMVGEVVGAYQSESVPLRVQFPHLGSDMRYWPGSALERVNEAPEVEAVDPLELVKDRRTGKVYDVLNDADREALFELMVSIEGARPEESWSHGAPTILWVLRELLDRLEPAFPQPGLPGSTLGRPFVPASSLMPTFEPMEPSLLVEDQHTGKVYDISTMAGREALAAVATGGPTPGSVEEERSVAAQGPRWLVWLP